MSRAAEPSSPAGWRARAVDRVLRQALVAAMDARDEDEAVAALAPLFFSPGRAARLTPVDQLRLASLAHALRTCLTERDGSTAAWAVATAIITELTVPPASAA